MVATSKQFFGLEKIVVRLLCVGNLPPASSLSRLVYVLGEGGSLDFQHNFRVVKIKMEKFRKLIFETY